MTDSEAIARLALYRLERDITFAELADEIARAGWVVNARTLHVALTGRLRGQSRERTRFKIRRFVEIKVVGDALTSATL